MIVRVRYFASLREAVGMEHENVELPEGATVQALLRALADRHSGLATPLQARGVRFAVNRCYALPDAVLNGGDEVAVVPPVGGG